EDHNVATGVGGSPVAATGEPQVLPRRDDQHLRGQSGAVGAAVVDHDHLDSHPLAGTQGRHRCVQVWLVPECADDRGDHGRRARWSVRKPTPQLTCMVASSTGTRARTGPGSPRLIIHPPAVTAPAYAATGITPRQACFHPVSPPIAA